MATLVNLVFVPSLVNADVTPTKLANSTGNPRVGSPPFPLNLAGSGDTDPIGPQRWPTKL